MDASLQSLDTRAEVTASADVRLPESSASALLQPGRRLSVGFWLAAIVLTLLCVFLVGSLVAQNSVRLAASAITQVEDQIENQTKSGGVITLATDRLSESAQHAYASLQEAGQIVWLVGALALAVGLLICVITAYVIVIPLRRLSERARNLADGDMATSAPRSAIRELDQLSLAVTHIGRRLAASERMVRGCYGWDVLSTASSRLRTESALLRACDAGEFMLYYQPQVSLTTMQTTAAEALLRWRLPNGTIVPAAEFFAVAEQCGLIQRLGEWVVTRAAESVREWRRNGWANARVAINASAEQFLASNFIAAVESLLRKSHLPPDCLELELTETVLQTGPSTIDTLHSLRLLGVSIALDDFGTGYSSLTSLEQLPLNRVKLDRSLLADVDTSPRSAAIVRSIIDLCRSLELQVTAEGVERTSQLDFLRARGDIVVQGYLIGPPTSADQVLGFVSQTRKHMAQLCASPAGSRASAATGHAAKDGVRGGIRLVTS